MAKAKGKLFNYYKKISTAFSFWTASQIQKAPRTRLPVQENSSCFSCTVRERFSHWTNSATFRTIVPFANQHFHHHSNWSRYPPQVLQQSSTHTEHFILFNSGWGITSIPQNGDGLLLMIFLFLSERINLWPQNVCLIWSHVAVKQDVAEPAAAGS